MSYVDAVLDKNTDKIIVIERDGKGVRQYNEFPANYVLYFTDPKGKHRSLYGDPVTRFSTRSRNEFEKERRILANKKIFESDINPIFRCLSEHYLNIDAPKLHTCFFDIEVDFNSEKGFSPTSDPFNPVTAISLYLDWLGQLVTLVIAPAHMSSETAQQITSGIENTMLFTNEIEMFETFFTLIEVYFSVLRP